MYKKLSFALTFISFLMLISCTANGKDKWKNVASIDEMFGEWEGILYLNTTPDSPMIETPVKICVSTDDMQNHLIEMIFDLNPILDFYIDGGNDLTKDEFWEMIISGFNYSEDNSEIFLEKYFLRVITTLLFEEQNTSGLNIYQINQHGDRLKMSFGDTIFKSIAVQGEVIFQKKG